MTYNYLRILYTYCCICTQNHPLIGSARTPRTSLDVCSNMMMCVWAALVWQLMRAYTLSLLNKLKALDQSGTSTDQQIVTWANNKVIDCFEHLDWSEITWLSCSLPRLMDVDCGVLNFFVWLRLRLWGRQFRTSGSNSNSGPKKTWTPTPGPKFLHKIRLRSRLLGLTVWHTHCALKGVK